MKLGRFLAGIIGGATFGVLFAPKKGSKLRKELTKGNVKALGRAFKYAGEDALEEVKKLSKHEQVEAFLQMSEDRIKEIAGNLEENNSEMVQAAKEKFEAISTFAMEKANDLKETLAQMEDEADFTTKNIPKKKKAPVKKKSPAKKKTLAPKKATKKKPATKKSSSTSKKVK